LDEGVQKEELKSLIKSLTAGMESLDNRFKKTNEFLSKYPSHDHVLNTHIAN
jgi:hypothetical protein